MYSIIKCAISNAVILQFFLHHPEKGRCLQRKIKVFESILQVFTRILAQCLLKCVNIFLYSVILLTSQVIANRTLAQETEKDSIGNILPALYQGSKMLPLPNILTKLGYSWQ